MLRSSFSSLTSKVSLLLHTHHLNLHNHGNLTHRISSCSYYSLLHSCKDLKTLKQVHASLIVSTDLEPISVASKLIILYTQFDDLESSVSVFEALREPNTVIWNLIIKSYVDLGFFDSALLLYRRMRRLGVEHDGFTFPLINRAVLSFGIGVEYGEMVHCVALQMGFSSDIYFCNTLIEAYLKCGCIDNARKVFDEMRYRDLVSWTSMISGYVNEVNLKNAFILFSEMRMELEPNSVTVLIMLQSCSILGREIEERQLHGYVIKKGLLMYGSVQNSVLRIYTKMGRAEEVERFWSEIDNRDFVSWNILISFYSSEGDIKKVAKLFNGMQRELIKPSIETLTLVISAIAKFCDLFKGYMLHCYAFKSGLYDNVLQTSLLDFYAKCGELEASLLLFSEISCRNSITWNAMMRGFIQNGYFKEAFELFRHMQAAGLELETEILINLVIACTHLGALQLGKTIHGYFIRNLYNVSGEDNSLMGTSLLNMYSRCGSISSAKTCFDKLVIKDIVTWTSMIEGFGTHGFGFEALKLFHQMVKEGMQPNSVTFLNLLSACSHSGLVHEGCEVFYSMKWVYGVEPDLDHCTCMVDLLGRCGKLKEALAIIVKLIAFPDSRIWGALLAASRIYEACNIGEYAARRLLELEPDNVGYYTLLSNVHASVDRWTEVEELRRVMRMNEWKKKPGWSCIEANGQIHGFVCGDRSHQHVEEIYEVLRYLAFALRR